MSLASQLTMHSPLRYRWISVSMDVKARNFIGSIIWLLYRTTRPRARFTCTCVDIHVCRQCRHFVSCAAPFSFSFFATAAPYSSGNAESSRPRRLSPQNVNVITVESRGYRFQGAAKIITSPENVYHQKTRKNKLFARGNAPYTRRAAALAPAVNGCR